MTATLTEAIQRIEPEPVAETWEQQHERWMTPVDYVDGTEADAVAWLERNYDDEMALVSFSDPSSLTRRYRDRTGLTHYTALGTEYRNHQRPMFEIINDLSAYGDYE